jgi:hypothetical protein
MKPSGTTVWASRITSLHLANSCQIRCNHLYLRTAQCSTLFEIGDAFKRTAKQLRTASYAERKCTSHGAAVISLSSPARSSPTPLPGSLDESLSSLPLYRLRRNGGLGCGPRKRQLELQNMSVEEMEQCSLRNGSAASGRNVGKWTTWAKRWDTHVITRQEALSIYA